MVVLELFASIRPKETKNLNKGKQIKADLTYFPLAYLSLQKGSLLAEQLNKTLSMHTRKLNSEAMKRRDIK